jgi:hypothetical protein
MYGVCILKVYGVCTLNVNGYGAYLNPMGIMSPLLVYCYLFA